jgi:hypothetical protein
MTFLKKTYKSKIKNLTDYREKYILLIYFIVIFLNILIYYQYDIFKVILHSLLNVNIEINYFVCMHLFRNNSHCHNVIVAYLM